MLQGIQRRQVNCVSERDGVLLPEGVCGQERPPEEQDCLLVAACHHSLPQTGPHPARSSLHSGGLAEATETRQSSPPPEEEATIWRIGDWGLVGLPFSLFFQKLSHVFDLLGNDRVNSSGSFLVLACMKTRDDIFFYALVQATL